MILRIFIANTLTRLESGRYETLCIANPTKSSCPNPGGKPHYGYIKYILKNTSLKNRNESLLTESIIELLHKKYITHTIKTAEKNKTCFNENILYKYCYYFPQDLK